MTEVIQGAPKFQELSLKAAGKNDEAKGLKFKLTGWGIISKDRHDRGISRKQRRLKK